MKWSLICLGVMSIVGGCRGAGAVRDPFLGRTTVPAPGTGNSNGPATPYYNPAPQNGFPTGAAPPAYGPPGGNYQYPQGSINAAPEWRTKNAPTTHPPGGHVPSELAATLPDTQGALYATSSEDDDSANVALTSGEEPIEEESGQDEPRSPARLPSDGNAIRIVEPAEDDLSRATSSSNAGPASWETRRAKPAEDVIDIADLPPARQNWR